MKISLDCLFKRYVIDLFVYKHENLESPQIVLHFPPTMNGKYILTRMNPRPFLQYNLYCM